MLGAPVRYILRCRRMDIMVRYEGTVCLGLLSDIYKDVGE